MNHMKDSQKKMGGKMKMIVIKASPDEIAKMLKQRENTYDANELVSSLAIEIWRLEKRINKVRDIINNGSDMNTNTVMDQLQRVKDIFKRQEIEVHDHTDEEYNDGMSVKVLHIEEINELPNGYMKIIETVKPSVYFKGQVISHGEVIVGKGPRAVKGAQNV